MVGLELRECRLARALPREQQATATASVSVAVQRPARVPLVVPRTVRAVGRAHPPVLRQPSGRVSGQ